MDRHHVRSDRHKVPRVMESGAEKRRKIKLEADKKSKLLSQTRRMTDFIKISEATAILPAAIAVHPELAESDAPFMITGDIEDDTIQTTVPTPLDDAVEPVTDQRTQESESGPSHDNIYTYCNATDIAQYADAGDDGFGNDIGMWPAIIEKKVAEFWIKNGTDKLQNCDEKLFEERSIRQAYIYMTGQASLKKPKRHRKCTSSMFERQNRNGEVVKRSWLCFSPAHGKLYCSVCRLVGLARTQLTHGGFCDWRHASVRLTKHETSKDHLDAVVAFARQAKELGTIECDMIRQLEVVENYGRKVLQRIVSVITFLCERGLALRGDNAFIGSPNNGNYLGVLELIAEYDDFLKHHIQKNANRGSGHTNYLSSIICAEFVQLMGKRVLSEITSRIKESRYYSISLDSTPGEGHVDQLTLVFRYMEKANPVERFVKFMPNQGHKAQDMFDGLVEFLEEHGIPMSNCRGQSYDNAAAMSGRYNGLQAKVSAENNLAAWIPCAGY